ncbi:hypothetical protein ACJRO7_008729 [Eucalyptus globulus]|uniref:Uncharacterized protein n=1 Tax=Eucalyptus globulus TaxID=34317 RepID=A0ABD3ITB1_EUCGL
MSHRAGRHQRKPSQSVFFNFGNFPDLAAGDNNAGAPAPPATPRTALPVAAQPPLLASAPAPAAVPKPAAPKEDAAGDGAKAKDLAD